MKRRQRHKEQQLFTLEEAFDYYYDPGQSADDLINTKRAIRAVGFLLHYSIGSAGNFEDETIADGLARVCAEIGDDLNRVFGLHDNELKLANLQVASLQTVLDKKNRKALKAARA